MSELRRLQPGDEAALESFLERLPPGDLTFIKEPVGEPGLAAAWIADAGVARGVAVEDGEIVGLAALVPGVGWSSHVGDLRLVIDPSRRRSGLGTALAGWALLEAVRQGLKKVVVEVVAEQEPAVSLFRGLGFEPEALLKDQIRDRSGKLRDLLMLAHHVDSNWSGLSTLGVGR